MRPSLISVVVTTYERPDALDAVLRGLSAQTARGFEVVVADDGSGPATRDVIASWQERLGVPVRHVRQADDGFRAAEARNRAVAASAGDYMVFLDGDCVPRPGFVASHAGLAEPGWFVAGNRVLLSPAGTARALSPGARPELWTATRLVRERLSGGLNRLLPALDLPDGAWRRARPDRWRGVRTCNLGVWRSDFAAVDGFDAEFQGWGLEDSDLAIRLLRAGVGRKDGRFATGVLHLWHAENDRSRLPENERRLAEVERSGRVRALRGLSTLSG
jgi:glycosyltransferase involved in cell wall biosynthesis